MIADFMKASLGSIGYTVSAHTQSSEALDDFKSRPDEIDLVITDQTMPGLSGVAVAKELLKVRHDIPIIMCTGYSAMVSEEKAKEIGIRRFIMKPIERNALAKTIRKVLDEAAS